MCKNGKIKLKYKKTISLLFCLVAYINPRVKVEGVENILNFIATCMNQPFKLEGKIYEQLNNLYKYYENKYGSASSSAITPSIFGNDQFFMQLGKGKQQVCPSSMCDLSKYLDSDYYSYISPNEKRKKNDIMNWWKSHESIFLVLSKMTRNQLTPLVSIVASEIAFSIAANIIGDHKICLAPDMLEALTFLKDWKVGRMGL